MKDIGGGLDSQYSHAIDNHPLNAQNIIMTATFVYRGKCTQTNVERKATSTVYRNFPAKQSKKRRFASKFVGSSDASLYETRLGAARELILYLELLICWAGSNGEIGTLMNYL